jgi:hypothetical protein
MCLLFDSRVIREALMVKQMQTLFVALEPLLRRVVSRQEMIDLQLHRACSNCSWIAVC